MPIPLKLDALSTVKVVVSMDESQASMLKLVVKVIEYEESLNAMGNVTTKDVPSAGK